MGAHIAVAPRLLLEWDIVVVFHLEMLIFEHFVFARGSVVGISFEISNRY